VPYSTCLVNISSIDVADTLRLFMFGSSAKTAMRMATIFSSAGRRRRSAAGLDLGAMAGSNDRLHRSEGDENAQARL
jgi:hypothetical protein